jgi:hypothetical protein
MQRVSLDVVLSFEWRWKRTVDVGLEAGDDADSDLLRSAAEHDGDRHGQSRHRNAIGVFFCRLFPTICESERMERPHFTEQFQLNVHDSTSFFPASAQMRKQERVGLHLVSGLRDLDRTDVQRDLNNIRHAA